MSKKKKKKDKFLKEFDKALSYSYDDLTEEIAEMQLRLKRADDKAKKKAKKKKKKNKDYSYEYSKERIKARKGIIEEMEGNNLLERAENFLKDVTPLVVIASRLLVALILAILSIDVVKLNIKPETMQRLDKVYKMAMSVSK